VKRLLRRPPAQPDASDPSIEAVRGRILVEESREVVVILDDADRVVTASRRARELFEGLEEGGTLPEHVRGDSSVAVPYEVGGRRETLLYLRDPGDMGAYEELRAGFTASVSHELRTPLARLLALLESSSLPNADHEAVIDQAQAEVGQIRELIDDVLFLSELESGREIVALGSTPALDLLHEVADGLRDSAERAGVSLVVEGDDVDLPLRPRMIRVIAGNLADNAIRYAGPGARCRLSVRADGDAVVLAAADDGAGVNEDDLPRLFERFYRVDSGRSREMGGTGLGLSIVKHLIEAMGGTIGVDSTPGKGATFWFTLPAFEPR
jgi:two-component system, OmpR family, phosphate regulon sensor histidine kinase PhoR